MAQRVRSNTTPLWERLRATFRWSTVGWADEARWLRWLTLLWLFVGLLVLLSASYASAAATEGDGWYYCKRQLIWIAVGLVGFQAAVVLPLRYVLGIAHWGLLTTLVLMWSLLIPGLGRSANGAVRWIEIAALPIQPSELLKPFLVLQSARILGQWERLDDRHRWFWLGTVGAVLLGILLQPNLSTAAVCGMTIWLLALAAGLPYAYLLGTAGGGLLLGLISISLREYQQRRIASFLNPWDDPLGIGYQLVQSLLAIGSGGWWGRGFGFSQQKLASLPIQFTDFIFSVFAEEFGFVGALLLIGLLVVYGLLGLRVAIKARDRSLRLVAVGSVVLLVGQAMVNIGVATGVLPTTGLPFPLISYGGSSAIASLFLAGLLVRVAREASAAPVVSLDRRRSRY
ncbi:MAG: cell division protein FtsW [Oscillatoriales cyanobacterium]|nr:MAG: cell division protein FtsW [Oscillatoriales cyanobacterium]